MTSKVLPAVAPRKPPAAGMGRKPGVPNRTTAALRQAILDAAEQVGADGKGKGGTTGYLMHLAQREPKAFAALLGKVLPLQINGDVQIGFVGLLAALNKQHGDGRG